MPRATFTISGEIEEFDRIDNVYRSLKTQGSKLLKNWEITVEAKYSEKEGEKE